jgi:hypothetical protein
MPAPRSPKSPDGKYDLLLRDVPGAILLALEHAADSEGRTPASQAVAVLRAWARRQEPLPDIPVLQPIQKSVRQLTAPEFQRPVSP